MDGIYEQLGIAEPEHEYVGQDELDGRAAAWRDDARDVESMQGAELEHVKMCQKAMLADKQGGEFKQDQLLEEESTLRDQDPAYEADVVGRSDEAVLNSAFREELICGNAPLERRRGWHASAKHVHTVLNAWAESLVKTVDAFAVPDRYRYPIDRGMSLVARDAKAVAPASPYLQWLFWDSVSDGTVRIVHVESAGLIHYRPPFRMNKHDLSEELARGIVQILFPVSGGQMTRASGKEMSQMPAPALRVHESLSAQIEAANCAECDAKCSACGTRRLHTVREDDGDADEEKLVLLVLVLVS